jgi:hypothetical protein
MFLFSGFTGFSQLSLCCPTAFISRIKTLPAHQHFTRHGDKMKKTLLTLLILLVLTLTACSGQTTTNASAAQQSLPAAESASQSSTSEPSANQEAANSTAQLNTSYDNTVPVEMQLVLGTLKLVGTDQTMTQDQAAVLLPLWSNLQSLSQSLGPGQPQQDSSSTSQSTNADTQQKIDALVEQIQQAMTPAQIQAIANMKITQDTAMALMQEIGITMGGPQGGGSMPQPPQGNPPDSNGTSGAGSPPTDEQKPPNGGQQPDNSQMPSPQGGMIPPQLLDSLIQTIGKIANGETVTTLPTASDSSSTGNPPSGSDSGSADSGLSTATGAYTLDDGTDTLSNQTYTASNTDQSGVYVLNSGTLTLNNATIYTSGNTSSDDKSSFYGLNAGVLAASGSQITMNGGSISTTGSGANGAFATGDGTTVSLSNVTINATGDGGHGVMATLGGVMNLTDVDMTTSGAHSAPIATDRGGGTINATGGTLNANGQDSPCYYSTGTLNIQNSTCNATGSEAVVIEGANTVNLTDSTLTSSVASKWGVMIYQSFSGDAQGTNGIFSMTGGSLSYTDASSPLFYVTNTTGNITLKGVKVNAASGILIKAEGNDRWGTSGSNGGTVILTADAQSLTGNLVADKISSITVTLQNGSSLTGAINTENTAQAANLTLDSSSTWDVTADSYLTCLSDLDGISGTNITNITGSGHNLYYDTSLCSQLRGQTYTLNGGGTLTPMK